METIKFLKSGGKTVYFESNPGGQTKMLLSQADETLVGSQRGSGMTFGLLAWMIMGDATIKDEKDPARFSFPLDPSYRGLLLVRDYSVMEKCEVARDMWIPLGARFSASDSTFVFRSGAKIFVRNMETKLRAIPEGLTRIGIDGLTDIPKEKKYLRLMEKLRNVRTDGNGKLKQPLPCRMMATTTCVGPGVDWVFKRFIGLQGAAGIAPAKMLSDLETGLTRTYIPMFFKENPYLAENRLYIGMMLMQDQELRRAWIDGDWSACGLIKASEASCPA